MLVLLPILRLTLAVAVVCMLASAASLEPVPKLVAPQASVCLPGGHMEATWEQQISCDIGWKRGGYP